MAPAGPREFPWPQAAVLGMLILREGPQHEGSANASSQAVTLLFLILACKCCFLVLGYLCASSWGTMICPPIPSVATLCLGGLVALAPCLPSLLLSGWCEPPSHSSAEPPVGLSQQGGLPRGAKHTREGQEVPFWGTPHIPAPLAGECMQPPTRSGPTPGMTSFPRRVLRNHSRSSVPAFPLPPGQEAQAEGGPRRPLGFSSCPAPGLPLVPPVPAQPGPRW